MSEISAFQTGDQDLQITQSQTINPGNFDEIEVKENISLTLNPGVYNLNKLELRDNSKLLFSGKTIINIKEELKINQKVLIGQISNIPSTDLEINFTGDKFITIGEDSLISVKIFSPKAKVNFGERTTFRGQILAKEIKVGEETLLSLDITTTREPRIENIVRVKPGDSFVVNELLLSLVSSTTLEDAMSIAESINGRIIGIVASINLYQIEVDTRNVEDLENLILNLESRLDPKIVGISRNSIFNPF